MKELLNKASQNLLESANRTVEEIVAEGVANYGLNRNDFRMFTCGNEAKVKSIVYYRRQVIFRVGILAGKGLEYFLEMTKEQARDVFTEYFSLKGDVA